MRLTAAVVILILLVGCGKEKGARIPESPVSDDPTTTNNESNDQAINHYGTVTLCVSTPHNGHHYTLDVDVDDSTVSEIYFPKGGNVDFEDCELDEDMTGECDDENGRTWEFSGEC